MIARSTFALHLMLVASTVALSPLVACGGAGSGESTDLGASALCSTTPEDCEARKKKDAGAKDAAHDATDAAKDSAASGAIKTVWLVLMENHNLSSILGSPSAPYTNGTLLKKGAHATGYVNLPGVHPSEPNYLWLEAGDDFGIANDGSPAQNHQATTSHLTTQLESAGVTWRAYVEGIGGNDCPLSTKGLYAPKHVPFVFFDDVTSGNSTTSARCIQHVRPYGELSGDLTGGNVAAYNFIVPDLCDDMHDSSGCTTSDSIKNGDTWLAKELPKLMASPAYAAGGAIFVTWDESEGGDFPIGMIVMSPLAKPGYANSVHYTHSSTLRTMQTIFGVGPFLGGAAKATDLGDLFTTFP
jgi:phosphatidylinositol-3-phosphatase